MKKLFLVLLAGTLVTGMTAFTGSNAVLAQKRLEGVTLDIPTMAGWRCVQPIWDREAEFTEKTGATFTIHGFPHVMLYSKEMAELVGGTRAFDLITGMQMSFALFQPYLMPLNEFIERDFGSIENFKKIFYGPAWKECVYNGRVKYVPYHFNAQYILYRKALFEDPAEKEAFKAQYGYELTPPKTREQLVNIAKFFTRPEKDLWGFVIWGKGAPGGWTMVSELFGAGFDMIDPKTGLVPFRSGAAREKAIDSARFWYDLVHTHKVAPPGTAAIAHTEAYEMYIGGHAAMSFGWWGDFYDRITSPEIIADIGESGSVVLPIVDPKAGIHISMWGYGIPKDSKNPEAAWEFIKWIITKDIQLTLSKDSGQASPIIEYNTTAMKNKWVADALRTELARGKQEPNIVQAYALSDTYWTYSSALFGGDLTPEEYIGTIVKKSEEIMK